MNKMQDWKKDILEPNVKTYVSWDDREIMAYPETEFELEPDKVVYFIEQLLKQAIDDAYWQGLQFMMPPFPEPNGEFMKRLDKYNEYSKDKLLKKYGIKDD